MSRVQLVEDDPLVQRYLRDLVERVVGVSISCWQPGESVLQQAREQRPELILLDITLRGATLDGAPTDGLELCRRIKAEFGASAPAVILLTARAGPDEGLELLQASGADAYQSKPILDEDSFLLQLREFLEQG